MSGDLQARLRRLGVVKGARQLKPAPRPAVRRAQRAPIESLIPGGQVEETDAGACFVVDKVYPLAHRHGPDELAGLLALSPDPAARFCDDSNLAGLNFGDFLFLDTETTGLAGAGTMAFMVGVGFFEERAFVVRQYFLRDHGDEPAMLSLLAELLAAKAGLITFNGRSFDLPLLNGRYLMNRRLTDLLERPHIDLLPPARRLWRRRLDSCALSSLEQHLLGVERSHDDVPGWLIPSLYRNYLLSGDPGELLGVFYHNQIDMLSMVTLAARIVRQFERPLDDDHPLDLVSLGRWQADLGLVAEAEQTLRLALACDPPLPVYHQALHRLGQLLKQNDRREEAVAVWQQIAVSSYDDVSAHVELAMHYEWQHHDPATALRWTDRALELVARWSPAQARLVRPELENRKGRLHRKMRET